jgi:hypothetical protein
MSSYIDIGHGVSIELRRMPGEDRPAGVAYKHPNGKGGECEGWAPFNGYPGGRDNEGWDVQSVEPLTISPSLLCRACQHHGFIREGKWVPA